MNKIHIGIDAGVKTGFAVWSSIRKEFINISTKTWWEAISSIKTWSHAVEPGVQLIVHVEDVSQNKSIFQLIPTYNNTPGNHTTKLSAAGKTAERIGRVKEKSDLVISYCEIYGITVIRHKPTKKSMTKLNAQTFKNITGYDKRTSEHARDAAMMIYDL